LCADGDVRLGMHQLQPQLKGRVVYCSYCTVVSLRGGTGYPGPAGRKFRTCEHYSPRSHGQHAPKATHKCSHTHLRTHTYMHALTHTLSLSRTLSHAHTPIHIRKKNTHRRPHIYAPKSRRHTELLMRTPPEACSYRYYDY
jgi:hypothetical protein